MTEPMTTQCEGLLNCPFCGGTAERHDFPTDEADGNAGGSVIQCTRCMASSAVHFDRKENLVSDWNRRPHPVPSQGEGFTPWDLVREKRTGRIGRVTEVLGTWIDWQPDDRRGQAQERTDISNLEHYDPLTGDQPKASITTELRKYANLLDRLDHLPGVPSAAATMRDAIDAINGLKGNISELKAAITKAEATPSDAAERGNG